MPFISNHVIAPIHPGTRIRDEILPSGMTVTEAARMLGVGRSALSNLLNGKAALSPGMAARLAKAFRHRPDDLLQMQADYDSAVSKQASAPAETRTHVLPFLGITANQIENWATNNILARTRFSVLIRTLVHSTGRALAWTSFPGNDDAERPGFDGEVDANEGTPWIPIGRSKWELGTNGDVRTKANSDFRKAVDALEPSARENSTFIFATPRRWKTKEDWLRDARSKGLWKEVRAYDAVNLEEWIEQSIPGQVWLANEAQLPTRNVRSLDRCWLDWANVSTPPMAAEFFTDAVAAARRTIQSRLGRHPDGPTLIAADSADEALAFLAQLFAATGSGELAALRDRIIVCDRPGTLVHLAQGSADIIPVVHTQEVERELACFANRMHCFIIHPRNVVEANPHVVLDAIRYEAFEKGLEEMGKSREDIGRLDRESSRSLTILRRRLATVRAIQMPTWAADTSAARKLVPFLLVGAWHSANETDRTALSLLAEERRYPDLESDCLVLTQRDDAPLWSVGTYRGVVSKVDMFHAIAGAITADDLKRFFSVADLILGEDDPALDLTEDQRWAAALHGKARQSSSVFREGISETLVLLAVRGSALFKTRLGLDTSRAAAEVVRRLLPAPLTARCLEAHSRDLPTYAEAAPDVFLSIIEDDLKTADPAVLKLLRPATGILGGPSRTGLIWALELLSWNPDNLLRTALVLARLAQIEIDDNWINKPMNSLEAIFRAWMPQTAATVETRVEVLNVLAKSYPEIAWKICLSQLTADFEIGHYNQKPRWRPDGKGCGEPANDLSTVRFRQAVADMILAWKPWTSGTLCDLVEHLHQHDQEFRSNVWALVEEWMSSASDDDKALMRERIRRHVLTSSAIRRAHRDANAAELVSKARSIYAALEPSDLERKHAWLFQDGWIHLEESIVETDQEFDYEEHERRIGEMRRDALREIYGRGGSDAILSMADRVGRASWAVGFIATRMLLDETERQALMYKAVQIGFHEHKQGRQQMLEGMLSACDEGKREIALRQAARELPADYVTEILMLAAYCSTTWNIVDSLDASSRQRYWREVDPPLARISEADTNESVERLLAADRPRAAFVSVSSSPERLDPQVLYRLLQAVASSDSEPPKTYLLREHSINKAFAHINKCQALTLEQKAGLEMLYIDTLRPTFDDDVATGIPNLERYVDAHPETFVQAIVLAFRRSDGGEDPPGLQASAAHVSARAKNAAKLLRALRKIPGHDDLGNVSEHLLRKWIDVVRRSCSEFGRAEIGDICVGELLSHAPIGKDGVWPSEPVRNVLEGVQSEAMLRGAHTGVYNARGVHVRGEGGEQERELSNMYRRWADRVRYSHPYLSARLLMRLVDTYEAQGSYEDTRTQIRRRLPEF